MPAQARCATPLPAGRAERASWQAGTVTALLIRDAAAADLDAIAEAAIAAGQDEEWSGSDPASVRHLLAHGRMVAAESGGAVTGPAPHPAVRPLLAAGWRSEYLDYFMATEPGLLDPHRAVPSPALA